MLDLELDLLKGASNLLESDQVLSGFGVPDSAVFLDEMVDKGWFLKPLSQFGKSGGFEVAF